MGWIEEMDRLRLCISIQFKDTRSSIIKECCSLVCTMADMMGTAFEDYMECLLLTLFDQLYVKIKVISVSCDKCIQCLLSKVQTLKPLSAILQGMRDSHIEVR